MSTFNDLLRGTARQTRREPLMPVQGIVVDVQETTCRVTIPSFDPLLYFGPIPFARSDNPPEPGNKCLVVFADNDLDHGWVVAWQLA